MTEASQIVAEADKVMEIIALIEAGESERGACERVGMNRATFRSRALKLGAADHYARAISALADAQTEALEKAIEDMREGKIDANMARVEIDARKWFASKFLPKRYGDKTAIVGGNPEQGDQPVRVAVDVSSMTPEQLAALANVRVGGE